MGVAVGISMPHEPLSTAPPAISRWLWWGKKKKNKWSRLKNIYKQTKPPYRSSIPVWKWRFTALAVLIQSGCSNDECCRILMTSARDCTCQVVALQNVIARTGGLDKVDVLTSKHAYFKDIAPKLWHSLQSARRVLSMSGTIVDGYGIWTNRSTSMTSPSRKVNMGN